MSLVETQQARTSATDSRHSSADVALPPSPALPRSSRCMTPLPVASVARSAWSFGPPASLRVPPPALAATVKAEADSGDDGNTETSVGSAASETASISDEEESLFSEVCGQTSPSTVSGGDSREFGPVGIQLNASAKEFTPGRTKLSAGAARFCPSNHALKGVVGVLVGPQPSLETKLNSKAEAFVPSVNDDVAQQDTLPLLGPPPGLETKLSPNAGAFVPSVATQEAVPPLVPATRLVSSSAQAALALHEAVASMPGPSLGLKTKLSCKAGSFVPSGIW